MKTEHYTDLGKWAELTAVALEFAEEFPTDAHYQKLADRRLKALRQLVKDYHRLNQGVAA
jgi:hypothetical protein